MAACVSLVIHYLYALGLEGSLFFRAAIIIMRKVSSKMYISFIADVCDCNLYGHVFRY